MTLLKSLVIAFSMYSKIPMPRVEWNEKNMKYAMCFFPLVGAVEGFLVYVLGGVLLSGSFGTLFFAAAMTILPLLVTGGIHMDGFLDTVDALSSFGDREKKLEILKDSHAGAFAILWMGVYLLWSAALWSEVKAEMLPVIAFGYVLSRSLSGISVVTFPAARGSGLVKTFQDGAQKKVVRVTMLLYIGAAVLAMFFVPLWNSTVNPLLYGSVNPLWYGAAATVAACLSFLYYERMCRKQFGGITGDLAGFFLQVCELAMLTGVVLAAKF